MTKTNKQDAQQIRYRRCHSPSRPIHGIQRHKQFQRYQRHLHIIYIPKSVKTQCHCLPHMHRMSGGSRCLPREMRKIRRQETTDDACRWLTMGSHAPSSLRVPDSILRFRTSMQCRDAPQFLQHAATSNYNAGRCDASQNFCNRYHA